MTSRRKRSTLPAVSRKTSARVSAGRAPARTARRRNTGEAAGENTNMGGMATTGTGTHGRRHRRGRRRAAAAAEAMTAAATPTGADGGVQTDLSGTYTGVINCLDASGDATLTVTGNQFTLSGASSRSGRITAVTTRGYTGATLRFDDASGGTPTSVSVRARKMGDRLMLSPVPGETNKCTFAPGRGGAGMSGGHRGRRGRRRGTMMAPPPPTATGEESATPAATPTPAPRTRSRSRGRRGGGNMNANMGDNSNTTPPLR